MLDQQSVNLFLNPKQEKPISNPSLVCTLVVDDFAAWRRFVITKLQENPSVRLIGVVSDGLEAVQKAEELQPDLIILDIGLPNLDGIEAARRIRRIAPNSKILFLSQQLDLDVVRAALSAGGDGYLVKSDAEDELFAAVEAVMSGKKFVSRRLAGGVSVDVADPQAATQFGHEEFIAAPPTVSKRIGRCHEVQFYGDDLFFLDGFVRFISAALKAEKAVIFVGTKLHRASLLQRLQAHDSDFRAAANLGRYIELDAAETLSVFMINDLPDRTRFLKFTSELIMSATQAAKGKHPRLAACGECAALLWAEGNAEATIQLEELWNEIARTYDMDILCGYPWKSFHSEEDSQIFRRICEEHSAAHSQ